ncbi:macro domain-containing protein [Streptococcus sp. SO2]|jgi:appr-1-p processing enzyme family protein|uniref:macro domain-containing protein n=1 Tax=Streptococcus sp. SO2 TaxID=3018248 RepID=UPI00263EB277|nr:macro domain-containing protein [Streptococcus sp. SO2]MDN5014755.1 macro domain-containing protein [Streptococcus sp. SO2]
MVIKYTQGDIFESKCQAIINTVNCEGKMGKGLAYQFKKKFPEMEQDYVKVCLKGELYPGKLHIYQEKNFLIINFPTKNKWREKSKIEYIIIGLRKLKEEIIKKGIKSVAIPPLGAGNGGLNWNEVKFEINRELLDMEDVVFEVYEPSTNINKKGKEPEINFDVLLLAYICKNLKKVDSSNLKSVVKLLSIFSQGNMKIANLKNSTKTMKSFKEFYSLKDYSEIYKLINSKLISNSIESKKRKWGNTDILIELVNGYPEYINDIINFLYTIENKSIIDNKNTNEIKEILIKNQLLSINLLEELEINYFE